MNKKFKAILFDKDGTLFDTEKYYQIAWVHIAEKMNIELTEEMKTALYGKSGEAQVQALHEAAPDIDASSFCEQIFQDAEDQMKKGIDLKPGVIETLDYFKNQSIPMGVASGGPMDLIQQNLEVTELSSYFTALSSGLEVPRSKPYPDVYLDICQKLKVDPMDCLVFEDSPVGVQSAKAAGCTVYMIPETMDAKEEAKNIYDQCFKSFHEFIEQQKSR